MDFFAQFINPEVKTRLQNLVQADFARVSYTEAIEIMKKS